MKVLYVLLVLLGLCSFSQAQELRPHEHIVGAMLYYDCKQLEAIVYIAVTEDESVSLITLSAHDESPLVIAKHLGYLKSLKSDSVKMVELNKSCQKT